MKKGNMRKLTLTAFFACLGYVLSTFAFFPQMAPFQHFVNVLAAVNVRQKTPLVHTITNFVTVNDCANTILAAGGSPTMAHDIAEVEEITSICQSLVLNMGAIGDRDAMLLAGRQSNLLGHPIILDPVGVGASALRTDTTKAFLKELKLAVIRGNISIGKLKIKIY